MDHAVSYCGFCANELVTDVVCGCITKQREAKRMRTFDTGAKRDSDVGKLDYDGFLSPIALERYAQYLNSHRTMPDGSVRESDNWQQGIPLDVYVKSMWRHFMDVWKIRRGWGPVYDTKDGHLILIDEALCAVIFNAMGYLHEIAAKQYKTTDEYKMPAYPDLYEDIVDSVPPPPPTYGWDQ